MTAHKHLKQLVRARMQKTGESYASARRQVIRQAPAAPADPAARWHFPGNIATTTALRVLLAHAGVRAPHTGEPYSEAMVFGLAGGIGAGVFAFAYEAADVATFYVAGRHSWREPLDYFQEACKRLGLSPNVRETAGARGAEKQLREALADGLCIAWVDAAHLPHRCLPSAWSGSGYHVITVYRIDDESGTALIGDLADDPIAISLPDLATARSRIKKDKHRLLSIPSGSSARHELAALIRDAFKSCHAELSGTKGKVMENFTLQAFHTWGERMHGSKDKQSWERVFTRGHRLWTGLTSIFDFIEHFGTGGGLCRPLFAEFLEEAADALQNESLRSLSKRYAEIGRAWTDLADVALPEEVPLFREAKELLVRKTALTIAGGGAEREQIQQIWKKLGELASQARAEFPLSEAECDALRARLQKRIFAQFEAEKAAIEALRSVAESL